MAMAGWWWQPDEQKMFAFSIWEKNPRGKCNLEVGNIRANKLSEEWLYLDKHYFIAIWIIVGSKE